MCRLPVIMMVYLVVTLPSRSRLTFRYDGLDSEPTSTYQIGKHLFTG